METIREFMSRCGISDSQEEQLRDFVFSQISEALYSAASKASHHHRVYDATFKINKKSIIESYQRKDIK